MKILEIDYLDGDKTVLKSFPDEGDNAGEIMVKHCYRNGIFSKHYIQCAIGPKDGNGRWKRDGVTVEELTASALLRTRILDAAVSNEHNKKAIEHLNAALDCFKARREERKGRGVLGTTKE